MTPKQQRFVQEYMIDLNATQAAIRAGYSPKTAAEQGYQLLHKTSVQEAVQDLQAEFRERMEVSRESVTIQLNTAYAMAEDNGQTAVMVQASMGIAKVHDRHLGGGSYSRPADPIPGLCELPQR